MNARDELMLDSMGPSSKGGFEIKTHAGGPETAETLLFIADSMRATLDAHDAPNYLEMEVKASDGKRYIMTLQRAGKITPHAARIAAEGALAAAKPRTISSVDELEALGSSATVLSATGTVWVSDGDCTEPWASVVEDPQGGPIWADSDAIPLPATVLYDPAVTS